MSIKKWKVLNQQFALDEKWFRVVKEKVLLPDGVVLTDYYTWLKGDVSLAIPMMDDGRFVLVRQYKHGIGDTVLEFPAGYQNEGESALSAAKRETLEETGITFSSWRPVGAWVNDATKERGNIHVFQAWNVKVIGEPKYDISEFIEQVRLTPAELLVAIKNGEIKTSASVAAAFMILMDSKMMLA